MPDPIEPLDWNVAVYCMNERARLGECLRRITADLAGCRAVVTVIINGSTDGSLTVAQAVAEAAVAGAPGIEIYTIAAADKANAINQFIHHLRHPARFYGEVDAYAFVSPGSFAALERRLSSLPIPNVVSGTCSNGRSMRAMTERTLKGGLTHGQFHAFPADFLDRMVARGIRLPLGVYYGDGLLGTLAAHDLDPQAHGWDDARVAGAAGATYEIPQVSPFRLADIKRQFRRKVRQMQGRMEAAAVRDVMAAGGFEDLPGHVGALLQPQIVANRLPPAAKLDRVFQALAVRNAGRLRPQAAERLVPKRA